MAARSFLDEFCPKYIADRGLEQTLNPRRIEAVLPAYKLRATFTDTNGIVTLEEMYWGRHTNQIIQFRRIVLEPDFHRTTRIIQYNNTGNILSHDEALQCLAVPPELPTDPIDELYRVIVVHKVPVGVRTEGVVEWRESGRGAEVYKCWLTLTINHTISLTKQTHDEIKEEVQWSATPDGRCQVIKGTTAVVVDFKRALEHWPI